MPCDAAGCFVSASMKPFKSLMVRPGGKSRVSRSLSNCDPDAVIDMVTRGLMWKQTMISSLLSIVAQKQFRRALTWWVRMGGGFLAYMQVFLKGGKRVWYCVQRVAGGEALGGQCVAG